MTQDPAASKRTGNPAAESRAYERSRCGGGSQDCRSYGREAKTGPVVYCGPSVRGVARQYTVYAGTIPAALADFIQAPQRPRGCW